MALLFGSSDIFIDRITNKSNIEMVTIGLMSMAAVAMITAGILSGKEELRKTHYHNFYSELMGYRY